MAQSVVLPEDGDAMLQRRRDGWASETAEERQARLQQFSASQQDANVLPSTQETPHTRRKHSTDSMPTCMSFHTTSMPADVCSRYMHTFSLPPLCNNPFSLRLPLVIITNALSPFMARKFKSVVQTKVA